MASPAFTSRPIIISSSTSAAGRWRPQLLLVLLLSWVTVAGHCRSGMKINKLWTKQRSEESKRLGGSRRSDENWVHVVDSLWNRLRRLAPSHLISMAVWRACYPVSEFVVGCVVRREQC